MSDVPRATNASDPARLVFFGSGGFAAPILRAIEALPETRLVGVVTLPDRPSGRHAIPTATPVAAAAEDLGVPILRLAGVRSPESIERIRALRPDLGVLADFGRIVPAELLAVPARGILNVHPSLLPRHRGATPIPATILGGDAIAGVSVIAMDEGLDTGPLVASVSWPLQGDETAPRLEAAAASAAADLVREVVPAWLAGEATAAPQPSEGATLTRPFRREDGRLDPGQAASSLERMVRAMQPWPGTFVDTVAGRLTVLEARVVPGKPGDEPGRFAEDDEGLAIETVDGRLRLELVRPAGSRAMSGRDHRHGAGRRLPGSDVVRLDPDPDRPTP